MQLVDGVWKLDRITAAAGRMRVNRVAIVAAVVVVAARCPVPRCRWRRPTTMAAPPITATGADVVDIRNTSGGLTRYTSIPNSSVFTTRGRRGPCGFTAYSAGTTYDGQDYVEGQAGQLDVAGCSSKQSSRAASTRIAPTDRPQSHGPLSQVGRVFEVYCDTIDSSHRHDHRLLDRLDARPTCARHEPVQRSCNSSNRSSTATRSSIVGAD